MNNETKVAIFQFVKYILNLFIFSFILVPPAALVWLLLSYNDFSVYSALNSIKEILLKMELTGNRNCSVIPALWLMIGTISAGLKWLINPWNRG